MTPAHPWAPGRPRGIVLLPFGPLERTHEGSQTELAAKLAVHPRQLHRWKHDGITPWVADELAICLGFHPMMIWGQEWEEAIDKAIARRDPVSPRRYSMLSRERAAVRNVPVNGVLPDRAKRCAAIGDRLCLTVQELADVFGISYERVRRAIHRGEIPSIRSGPKTLLVPRSWLEGTRVSEVQG